MNRLLATTALALLLGIGSAAAQAPADNPADSEASPPAAQPSPSPEASSPEASPPSAMPSEEPASPAPDQSSEAPKSISPQASDEAAAPSATASAQFLNEQKSNDYLASNLIGLTVMNAENERLGEINDLVTDENGKILAALVGVGGFLGIGEKDVAVRFEDLKLSRDENNDITASLSANQDTLASAPDFQTLDEKEVAVGSDSGASAPKPQ
jgi:sporulation protein YlmC with PRC-barrel domain